MKTRIVATLALVPTPLLLFVSPAVRLYVGNQEDLHYQSSVLLPFVWVALATLALGALLWALSERRVGRFFTWGYLLLGPFLLVFRFLQSAPIPSLLGVAVGWSVETTWGLASWCVLWLVIAIVLTGRFEPRSIVNLMAAFGVVLLAGDVFTLTASSRPSSVDDRSLRSAAAPASTSSSASVYHIVLDELQTEVLELLRTPELDETLGGFVYFPNNETIYHATVMSLSSAFTGRRYHYDEPRGRYIETGFGDRSFVGQFASAGYRTMAIVPNTDPLESDTDGFENVYHHADNFERSATMNASAFENLWIVANIPSVILDALGSRGWLSERTLGELRLTRAGRALTDSAPVASAMSFRELIEAEPQLSMAGRYTFVHLLIPHSPYVLRSDCDYLEWDRSEDPLEQTECTLGLLDELFDTIEALGRFEDAFIVVHGDHGAPFRMQRGELVRARARSSRTPLMFKPPGRRRDVDLAICDVETTLLDVAPTVLDMIGLPLHPGFEGFSLRPAIESCTTP